MENRNEKLLKILQNEPLSTTRGDSLLLKNLNSTEPEGSVFIGCGVMTSKNLSIGTPFDILEMIFFSELLKRELNLLKVNILIADSHAQSNNLFPGSDIEKATRESNTTLIKIIRNFALKDFEIILGSELHNQSSFQQILKSLPKIKNQYLRLETVDVLWMTQNQDLRIKIGWALENKDRITGNDERFFDLKIQKFCSTVSFIHLKPGHTLDKIRPRVSPYLSTEGENRILLKRNENVLEKINSAKRSWDDKTLGGAIGHFSDIVRLFEKLQGKLPFETLEEKMQFLINKAVA